MRRLLISLVTLALAAAASAVVVDNIAGALESNTTDHEITELTVTGTIDARDFKFIADSLIQLKRLDLSQAQIVAYSDSIKPLSGTFFKFPAGELPPTILMGTEIDSLALPETLTGIGHAALAGCTQLTALVLPETLTTIGSYAFSGTSLTQVTVPQSVTSIGEGAWAQCHALTSASLNAQVVPDHAFMGDSLLTDVTLGNNVTTIGKSAFNGCSALDSIKVGEGNNITSIGTEAFLGASAKGIDLQKFAMLEGVGNWAFASSGLATATLPQNVSTVGDGAFAFTDSLQQATLPAIKAIPAFAFASSALANDGILAEGTESIGDYAFYNNDKASVFTIPASVCYLGNWAMAGMVELDTINAVPTAVPALGDSVWAGVMQSLVMLNTADNDIADLYEAMEQWKEFHILRNYYVGDVNHDGYVDITDINCILAYILNDPIPGFDADAADLNGDGDIDIVDVNVLVDIILNNRKEYIRKANRRNASEGNGTSDCISIDDININAGETVEVTLGLENVRAYSGMQFDIDMPEGLSIVDGSLRNTSRTTKHTLVLSNDGNRIMVYSPGVVGIEEGDGAIISLKVKANGQLEPQGTVAITNLVLTTPKSERFVGSDTFATVSGVTGVDDMNASLDKAYAYNSTLIIEAMNDGKAQVVAMNGQTVDVNVLAGRNEVDMPAGIYVVLVGGKSFKVIIK